MSKLGEELIEAANQMLAYARGEDVPGVRVRKVPVAPKVVNVKAIRKRSGLSQAKFAAKYGFSVDAVRNWEHGRRYPDVAARVLLTVIDKEPEAVERALAS
jgi:putative transcriptional regulator